MAVRADDEPMSQHGAAFASKRVVSPNRRIHAALPHRDHLGTGREMTQVGLGVAIEAARVVRVHACGRAQHARSRGREFER